MKNLITGLLFASLAWSAAFAEPVEPAPTLPPPATTTSTPVTQPAPPVRDPDRVKAEASATTAKNEPGPAAEEKPRKKKRPLEIKWIDF